MIAYFLILLTACFLSLIAGHFIPPISFLEGARVCLMPVVFFYGALALPYGVMLFLALACGLMWDALTVQIIPLHVGSEIKATVEIMFGWSIVLYAVLGSVVSGFRPLYLRGRWEIHCLMSGVCVSFMMLSEFLFLSVRRISLYEATGFTVTPEIWWRIGGSGLIALLLAPLVYWVMTTLAQLANYNPKAYDAPKEAKP